ncbi:uncharacterized protein LOC129263377 [Lytechinus pictus]|uniref:uncharacterized protein LOC129263377 n=1 Tax=Lytechinus pictus TaxID=7653 RepID=UPI0030B9F5EC
MAASTKPKRFASFDEEEFSKILGNKDADSTKRSTKQAITLFKEYLFEKCIDIDLETVDKSTLAPILRRKFTRSGAPPAPRSPVVDHHRSPDRYRSPVGYPPVGYLDPPPVGYLDPPPAALGSHPHLDLYRSLDLGYRSPVAHVQDEDVPTPPPRGIKYSVLKGRNVGSFSTRKSLQISEESNDDPDTIRLENHGIEVRIPRNEAYSAKDFIVNAITDVPPELLIKENEAIITVGLEIRLPSDAVFGHPVEITMPHCGRFTKPEKVEIVSYYRQSASKQFVAISSSIGVSPRCVVRHSDLDISFNHFSEYWIVAILEEVFVGKRVICTPYVPVRPLKNSMSVLFLQVRDANEHEEESHT